MPPSIHDQPGKTLYACVGYAGTADQNVWVLESMFTIPSFTLRNIVSGEKQTFGQGSLNALKFIKLEQVKDVR